MREHFTFQLELHAANSKFERSSWRNAVTIRWNRILDPLTQRQIKLLSTKRHYALNDTQFHEVSYGHWMSPNVTKSLCKVFSLLTGFLQLQQLIVDLKDVFTKARICPYHGTFSGPCELVLDPGRPVSTTSWRINQNAYWSILFSTDALKILAKSRDYEEQLHVWKSWRDAVGPSIKQKYLRYIELINESAKRNGRLFVEINCLQMTFSLYSRSSVPKCVSRIVYEDRGD